MNENLKELIKDVTLVICIFACFIMLYTLTALFN